MKSATFLLWSALLAQFAWFTVSSAQDQPTPSDSSSTTTRSDTLSQTPSRVIPTSPVSLLLDDNQLWSLDQEEFGDWIAIMPGFYPLDRGGLASAYYGQVLGLPPSQIRLNFRGREMEDPLLGAPQLSWIPPQALAGAHYQPFSLLTPGVSIQADLRTLEPVPPASRISTRDGFYGLGTVDFDLAQKITPAVILNGGGRVANFDGRLPHSLGYGLNLRAEVSFRVDSSLTGWAGLMQNKLNAEVPFSSANHNRDRYEADLHFRWQTLSGGLFGVQQRESYAGGQSDGWDEIGLLVIQASANDKVAVSHQIRLSTARWRLKNRDWTPTTFGDIQTLLTGSILPWLEPTAFLRLQLSDDFAPARHLGLILKTKTPRTLNPFACITQHQRHPSRFETAADFLPGTHFTPYDPVLLQNPNATIIGAPGLRNETYTTIQTGLEVKSQIGQVILGGFWRRVEDPIVWQLVSGDLRPFNANNEEQSGLLGWGSWRGIPSLEVGATGSFLPLKSDEKRIFPEIMGHLWLQDEQHFFQEELIIRLRVWSDFWGKRSLPISGGWNAAEDDWVLSARLSADLLGVRIFYEVLNILSEDYELYPGYPMAHKEEVWGISWSFTN